MWRKDALGVLSYQALKGVGCNQDFMKCKGGDGQNQKRDLVKTIKKGLPGNDWPLLKEGCVAP